MLFSIIIILRCERIETVGINSTEHHSSSSVFTQFDTRGPDSSISTTMATSDGYDRAGVPTSLLGCSYKSWTRAQLAAVLDHYAASYQDKASKSDLMKALHLFTQQQPSSSRDKFRILNHQLPLVCREQVNSVMASTPPEDVPILEKEYTVCLEKFIAADFPERQVTTSCDHPPVVCKQCLSK